MGAGISLLPRELPQISIYRADISRLLTFGTCRNIKRNPLILAEGLKTLHLNGREMCEQIFTTTVHGDETETLRFVKPLNSTR